MEKTLLTLLEEEKNNFLLARYNRESYNQMVELDESLALKYKEEQEKAEQELLNCRKEIARYLEFLEAFVKEEE